MTWYEIWQSALAGASTAVLALIALAVGVCIAVVYLTPIIRWVKKHKGEALFVAPFVICMVWVGSSKFTPTITYPRTDPETWYLMNNGSYVSNDFVHVAYNRNLILPASANLFIECLESCYSNQTDWASHSILAYSNTIENSSSPFDLPWPAASNYNWIVYTDWTPPPTTHTNGVAYATWQRPINGSTGIVTTIKTGIYIDHIRISPSHAITNGLKTTVNLLSTPQEETPEQ